jgi:hypothetical protein
MSVRNEDGLASETLEAAKRNRHERSSLRMAGNKGRREITGNGKISHMGDSSNQPMGSYSRSSSALGYIHSCRSARMGSTRIARRAGT